jgi:hypothetical protein
VARSFSTFNFSIIQSFQKVAAHLRQVGRNLVSHRLIGRLHSTTAPRQAGIFENLDAGPTSRGLGREPLFEHLGIGRMEPDTSRCVHGAHVDRLLNQSTNIELTDFDGFVDDSRSHSDSDLDCQILQLSQILDANPSGLFQLE